MGLNLGKLARAIRDTNLIITPRYNQWLMQHGDEGYPEWVVTKIAAQILEVPRIRHSSFSSSSAGICNRRQVLQYLGVPSGETIDPQLQNLFNDGKWRHLRLQACMLAAGIVEDIEFPLTWKRMRSRGTVDGVGVVPMDHPNAKWRGLTFGVEYKGVSPFQFQLYKNDEFKEEHHKQVDRYFLSGGFDLMVIFYENKGSQEWFEWVVENDPQRMIDTELELKLLNASVDNKRLPGMLPGCIRRNGPEWKDCPFAGKHQAPCPSAGKWPKNIAGDLGKVTY